MKFLKFFAGLLVVCFTGSIMGDVAKFYGSPPKHATEVVGQLVGLVSVIVGLYISVRCYLWLDDISTNILTSYRKPTEADKQWDQQLRLIGDYVSKVERGETVTAIPEGKFVLNHNEVEMLNLVGCGYWQRVTVRKPGAYMGVGVGSVMTGQYYQGNQVIRMKKLDVGDILITNQNLYFGGAQSSFKIAYATVVRIQLYASGLEGMKGIFYGFSLSQNAGEFMFEVGSGLNELTYRLVTVLLSRSRGT